jgi:histidinol-phosphate phosphatase family protein
MNYLRHPEQIELLPGAIEGLQLLRDAGWLLLMATNQSGVARGYFSEARLAEIHKALQSLLQRQGVQMDAIYYCPHHPDDHCECRKPLPGMLIQAAKEWYVNLAESYVVGDSERDVESGKRAGCRAVLIAPLTPRSTAADVVAPTLVEAARRILSGGRHP